MTKPTHTWRGYDVVIVGKPRPVPGANATDGLGVDVRVVGGFLDGQSFPALTGHLVKIAR